MNTDMPAEVDFSDSVPNPYIGKVRMSETKGSIDYVATYLYPWACKRNQIRRPESVDIDRLRRQLKRKRDSFERSFTRIK